MELTSCSFIATAAKLGVKVGGWLMALMVTVSVNVLYRPPLSVAWIAGAKQLYSISR